MDYASPSALRLRRLGQRLGVLRPVVRAFRRVTGKSYEEAFDAQLMAEMQPGDIVWDIGANVGFYSRKFGEAVGAGGRVLAFEPSPEALEALRLVEQAQGNVAIAAVALSDAPGTASFFTSTKGSSVTDGLRKASDTDIETVVTVSTGDSFLSSGAPNVIKIDVEGYELDVLKGLPQTLADPALRAVFVEVHFLECARRGVPDAPAQVAAILRAAGYAIAWPDPSHLVARHPRNA